MNYTKYTLNNPIIYTQTAVEFSINVTNIQLNKMAYIHVCLHDERGGVIDNRFFNLEGEDYDLWQSDEYLIQWIRSKL
jgi:hypothetical protein